MDSETTCFLLLKFLLSELSIVFFPLSLCSRDRCGAMFFLKKSEILCDAVGSSQRKLMLVKLFK